MLPCEEFFWHRTTPKDPATLVDSYCHFFRLPRLTAEDMVIDSDWVSSGTSLPSANRKTSAGATYAAKQPPAPRMPQRPPSAAAAAKWRANRAAGAPTNVTDAPQMGRRCHHAGGEYVNSGSRGGVGGVRDENAMSSMLRIWGYVFCWRNQWRSQDFLKEGSRIRRYVFMSTKVTL